MATFDPFRWAERAANSEFVAPRGWLHLKASAPGALYILCEGVEVIGGYGTDIRLQLPAGCSYRFEADKDTRVFVESHGQTYHKSDGEVFTNMDRTPAESGNMLEVQRALRLFQLEQRETLKALQNERRSLAADRKKRKAETEDKTDGGPDLSNPAEPAPDEAEQAEPQNKDSEE